MKRNTLYKKVLAVLIVACGFTSCDYLDVVPTEQAQIKDAFQDPESTLGFLYSCYSGLNNWNPINYTNEDVSSTDEFVMPVGWSGNAFNIQTNQRSSSTGGDWHWRYCGYDHIRICHQFIEGVQSAPKVSDAQKAAWTAEAKFLVAYYHFMVLRKYGPCPILDKLTNTDAQGSNVPGRSHYDAVTKYIVDLIDSPEVMNNLPARWTEGDWGRVDQVVAKAVKARVLLYAASPLWNGNTLYESGELKWENENCETEGYGKKLVSTEYSRKKWEDARNACEEALTFAKSQGLELYTNSNFDELNDLPGRFTQEQKDFMKHVFRMRYALLSRANSTGKCQEVVWGVSGQTSTPIASMPRRMFQKTGGTWVDGWSGISPTLNAVEMFYTKNGKLPREDSDFYKESEWFEAADNVMSEPSYKGLIKLGEVIKLNTKREPRFYAWLAFSGGEYGTKLIQGNPLILEMRNKERQGYNLETSNRDYCFTGYLCQKWIHPGLSYNTGGSDNAGSVSSPRPLIRMAELYLNLAECEANLGNNPNFLKAINPVRERAGIPVLTQTDLTSTKTAVEWVHNERFIEFYGEGIRYYDVRRWKEAKKYFDGPYYGLNVAETAGPSFDQFNKRVVIHQYQEVKWNDRLYLMPLYFEEVDKSETMIQAPGY